MIHENIEAETTVFGPRSIPERQQIILYELGMMTRSLVHMESSIDPLERKAELANAFVEMLDVVTQVAMLHQQLFELGASIGLKYLPTWEEVLSDGMQRQKERMIEWMERREPKRTV